MKNLERQVDELTKQTQVTTDPVGRRVLNVRQERLRERLLVLLGRELAAA